MAPARRFPSSRRRKLKLESSIPSLGWSCVTFRGPSRWALPPFAVDEQRMAAASGKSEVPASTVRRILLPFEPDRAWFVFDRRGGVAERPR